MKRMGEGGVSTGGMRVAGRMKKEKSSEKLSESESGEVARSVASGSTVYGNTFSLAGSYCEYRSIVTTIVQISSRWNRIARLSIPPS